MTAASPFVETARQLVRSIYWAPAPVLYPVYGTFGGRDLRWRHHGLGMLQAEFSETLRIHIWHPKLVAEGMAWPRCVHDHRFDILSAVVVGEVLDVQCVVSEEAVFKHPSIAWQDVRIYEIEHAKEQDRMVSGKGCSTATSAKCLGQGWLRANDPTRHKVGTSYVLPRRTFHTTRVEDLAITIIHRSNFDDRLARVLCAPESDVTAVSGIVRDEGAGHVALCNWVLAEAAYAARHL